MVLAVVVPMVSNWKPWLIYLTYLLPNGRKLFMDPTRFSTFYMMDTHTRATVQKYEVHNLVLQLICMAYWLHYRKGSPLKTWFKNYFTRFTKWRRDYEPYSIGLRVLYPICIARFTGYDSKKSTGCMGPKKGSSKIGVGGILVVTQFNHFENMWVNKMHFTHYVPFFLTH